MLYRSLPWLRSLRQRLLERVASFLRSPTGAMIVVNDTGILYQQRQRCIHRDDRTERDDQQSSPGGDLICPAFWFTSAPRYCVPTPARPADRAQSARAGQRPADGADDLALCGGRLHLAAAAGGQRPMRDRAVADAARTRVLSNGQPLLVQSSQAICAPTGTPLLIMVPRKRA